MISIRNELLKTMRAVPIVVRALVRDTDEAGSRWRPAAGEWAIVEVIAHMADTDERALERVRRILAEDEPALPSFDQDALAFERRYIDLPLASEVDRLERQRGLHIALLQSLDDAGWLRTGRHEEHGLMSIELYETHVGAEDVDHLAQIARLVTGAAAAS
jgi:hypothetical protein